jgi:hypothetical protein
MFKTPYFTLPIHRPATQLYTDTTMWHNTILVGRPAAATGEMYLSLNKTMRSRDARETVVSNL